MKTIQKLGWAVALALTSGHASAQSTNEVQINSSVFASSGGTSSGGGYSLTHTLGEAIVGTSSGGNYTLVAGIPTSDATEPGVDLKLTSSLAPIVVTENIAHNFTLSVSNNGASNATVVQLTVNLPTGLHVSAATNSAGPCQVSTRNVICSVASLASNGDFTVQLTLLATPLPEAANEFEDLSDLTCVVSSAETDADPADNSFTLPVTVFLRLDWGDARGGFPVTRDENGARHRYWPGYRMGALWDSEGTGVHSPLANWDDGQQTSDEDGVTFPNPIIAGSPATVVVNSSFPGFLDAWADFNNNTNWDDSGEQIFTSEPLVVGNNTLTFHVPPTAVAASNISTRWRASTTGGLRYTGYGGKGEVEDHVITVHAALKPALQVSSGGATFTFQTESQVNYLVEYTDSLTAPNWQLLTRVTGSGQDVVVSDGAIHPQRFYRIRVE